MRKKGIIGCTVLAVFLFLAAVVLFSGSRSVVDANDGREKRFTSIQVKEGDSLWSIAEERMSREYDSLMIIFRKCVILTIFMTRRLRRICIW